MHRSLLTRFFREFLKQFWPTVTENKFDKIVVAAAVVYLFFRRLIGERWEFVIPLVWAVCFIAVYHAFKAAHSVKKEIDVELCEQPSPLYDPSGQHPTIPHQATMPFLYGVRLYGIASVFLLAFGYVGFSAW